MFCYDSDGKQGKTLSVTTAAIPALPRLSLDRRGKIPSVTLIENVMKYTKSIVFMILILTITGCQSNVPSKPHPVSFSSKWSLSNEFTPTGKPGVNKAMEEVWIFVDGERYRIEKMDTKNSVMKRTIAIGDGTNNHHGYCIKILEGGVNSMSLPLSQFFPGTDADGPPKAFWLRTLERKERFGGMVAGRLTDIYVTKIKNYDDRVIEITGWVDRETGIILKMTENISDGVRNFYECVSITFGPVSDPEIFKPTCQDYFLK
jgi:hypothetical protein